MVREGSTKHSNVADSTQLFNRFIQAQTCQQTFTTFLDLCKAIDLPYPPSPSSQSASSLLSSDHISFYPRLKKKLSSSWKAQSLWAKLDKRFFGKEYFVNQKVQKAGAQRVGAHMKVVVIGAGPCGLRTAIEMACLGTKTVVLEKRDSFSRNNVLHLWPYIITDLKALGAKKLYGRFCAGAIDHISIRQLQLILLKLSLMLGVEIILNISFEALISPTEFIDKNRNNVRGWTAAVNPSNHPISKFQFDVVIGADGKRNTLQGFKRKEFRGKLAIGLTVNFINRNTTAEAKVEEISGVAYIFNQEFFKNLQSETGIDLENIVYYKGETHYFVMTAKKHSLVAKGVLKQDYDDTSKLLSYKNVDRQAMMSYAKEAADFSTHHQLPTVDFAINQYGEPDVALFDFTCMYASENAALFREVKGHKLLSCLVGDSLLEPFWPMGTGCARGFFAAFDAVWMTRQWATKRTDKSSSDISVELQVLAERESVYRLLHQTTPQNTMKNVVSYTIDPNTRYVNLNTKSVSPNQAKKYYLADRETPVVVDHKKKSVKSVPVVKSEPEKRNPSRSTLTRNVSLIRSGKLQTWCQKITEGYKDVHITNMTSSWKSGLAICAIIHQFRPDLINWNELDFTNIEKTNQLAFDIAETQLGISPVMTGIEMSQCDQVDKLLMVTYISQFYEMFKHETPSGLLPSSPDVASSKEEQEEVRKPRGVSLSSPIGLLARIHIHMKRRSVQNKHNDQAKKKKQSLMKKKGDSSPSEPALPSVQESKSPEKKTEQKAAQSHPSSIDVGGTNVKLRPKKLVLDDVESGKATVSQRASDRISALSSQLISQWEQNAPQPSPRPAKRNEQSDLLTETASASDMCYFCKQRVYIVERLSAEGFFFHRHCFVCSHCGLTLRRGAYEFVQETGKFFCHANCIALAETCKHLPILHEEKNAHEIDGSARTKEEEKKAYQTPERIELENIRMSMINEPEELSEEAVTRHNFSINADHDETCVPDIEYMSDSSDDDIDWEDMLKKATDGKEHGRDEESDYDENDSLMSHSSLEGRTASNHVNDVTVTSWLEDSCNGDQIGNGSILNISHPMAGIPEDEGESRSSTLVKRKTISNLVSCDSFNELHKVTALSLPPLKGEEQGRNGTSKKTAWSFHNLSSSKAHGANSSVAASDFKRFPLAKKDKEIICSSTGAEPVPTNVDVAKNNSQFDKVFERLLVKDPIPCHKNSPSECVFLSLSKKEIETLDIAPSQPEDCQNVYLPRKELAVLSSKYDVDCNRNVQIVNTSDRAASAKNLKDWLFGQSQFLKLEMSHKNNIKEKPDSKDSDLSDDASVADVSSHDSLSDTPEEDKTDQEEALLSSSSSLSDAVEKEDLSDRLQSQLEGKQATYRAGLRKAAATLRDSLSSPSTDSASESLRNTKELKEELVRRTEIKTSKADRTSAAFSNACYEDILISGKSPEAKPTSVRNPDREDAGCGDSSSSDFDDDTFTKLKRETREQFKKYDTLDRVQEYLLSTPLDPSVSNSIKEKLRESDSSSSISLSSSTTSDDADHHLLQEKDLKTKPPVDSVTKTPMKRQGKVDQETSTAKSLSQPQLSGTRRAPSDPSIDNVSTKTTTFKNNTSTWSGLGDAVRNVQPRKDPHEKEANGLVSSFNEETQQSKPSIERRLSHESLERRIKLRLRAKNRQLQQDSNRGTLSQSSSNRSSGSSFSSTDTTRSKEDVSPSPPQGMVIIESSPSMETFLTPTAPPKSRQQSGDFAEDSFHTPLGDLLKDQCDLSPEVFTISPPLPAARTYLDDTDEFVSAPTTPASGQKAVTPQSKPKRELPPLPKVPYLEAISPTGSAQSTLSRPGGRSKEDVKVKEMRIRAKLEQVKAETLKKNNQSSNSKSPLQIDTSEIPKAKGTLGEMGHGASPEPTRKRLFKTKGKMKKSHSNDEDFSIKHALPKPHTGKQPTPRKESKDRGKKHGRKSDTKKTPDSQHTSLTGHKDKKSKGFFHRSPRNKHKKEKSFIPVQSIDGVTTLQRKYSNESDREKAILRGERFRIVPDPTLQDEDNQSPNEDDSRKYWQFRRRATLASLTPAQIDAKITKRVQTAARRQAKLEAQKRLRRAQVIQRQLEEVEVRQKNLEERGVILEKSLRHDGEEREDSKDMQEWFELVQEKNGLLRYENELMVYQRELQLEDMQSRLQQELRERMAMDDKRKSSAELAQEKEILQKMLDVVEQRDELVALLEEQRVKERDDSADPETQMLGKFNVLSDDTDSTPSQHALFSQQ